MTAAAAAAPAAGDGSFPSTAQMRSSDNHHQHHRVTTSLSLNKAPRTVRIKFGETCMQQETLMGQYHRPMSANATANGHNGRRARLVRA